MIKNADTSWAYLAGLIDGEGCISATRRANGNSWGAQLSIKQRVPDALVWVHEIFRIGTLTQRSDYSIWRVRAREELIHILLGTVGYLTLKHKQALAALELCERPISAEKMEQLAYTLKELKQRG